jgi:CheY-like chemotaxis protein
VPGRVLVVDDEPILGRAMKRVLDREHEVVVMTSGQETQKLLERDREFDVIICDLLMPVVTGMDLYDWIAEKYPELARRVVFLSGGAFTQRARQFLDQVPNARFEKPMEPKNLLELVRSLVIKRRGSRT